MIKPQDLKIKLDTIKNTVSFGYGEFKLTDSFITNFGVRKSDGTLDKDKAQNVLDMYVDKAFSIVKKNIDINRILSNVVSFDYFSDEVKEGIIRTTIDQLEGMLGDSVFENKTGAVYSGQGAEASEDASSFLITNDRVYKTAETRWEEYGLDSLKFDIDEDGNLILVGEVDGFAFKFLTGQRVDSISLIGQDKTIPATDEVQRMINLMATHGAKPRGTWEAASPQEAAQITQIFLSTGLTLTNGDVLNHTNTHVGDTVFVSVPSKPNMVPEIAGYDGLAWYGVTNNNIVNAQLDVLEDNVQDLETKKLAKTDLENDIVTGDGTSTEKLVGSSEKIVGESRLTFEINKVSQQVATRLTAMQSHLNDTNTKVSKNESDILKNKNQIAINKAGITIFEDERAEYVKVSDIKSQVKIIVPSSLNWTINGQDLELDISSLKLSGLVNGEETIIKNEATGHKSVYISDSFNDASVTEQTITLDGKNETINVQISSSKIIVKSLSSSGRTYWRDNVKTVYIEQSGATASSNIDSHARGLATAAQSKANTNAINIVSNEDAIKDNKKLLGNLPFFMDEQSIGSTNPLSGEAWKTGDTIVIKLHSQTNKSEILSYDDNDNWDIMTKSYKPKHKRFFIRTINSSDTNLKWTNETDPVKIKKQFESIKYIGCLVGAKIVPFNANSDYWDYFIDLDNKIRVQNDGIIKNENIRVDYFIMTYDENAWKGE